MSIDKFEIRITADSSGKDTSLGAMSIEESKAFAALLDAVNRIAEQSDDKDKLRINVRNGSAALALVGPPVHNLHVYFSQIRERNSTNSQLVESFRIIQNVFQEQYLEFHANFYIDGKKEDVLEDFTKSRRFITKSIKRSPNVKLIFLKGQLMEVGGVNPNFHIHDSNKSSLKITCNAQDATRVNHLLYKEIYISAWEISKPGYKKTYTFSDHFSRLTDFDFYRKFEESASDLSHYDYVNQINNLLRDFLKAKELEKARTFMKMFNHNSVDNGILKIILILTKHFQNESQISDIRGSIKKILEKKRGSKLI